MSEIRWVTSTDGSVALDDRTFPVVFATWAGAADATTIRAFFDWNGAVLARATKEKRVLSLIARVQARFVERGAPWPEGLTPSGYVPARR